MAWTEDIELFSKHNEEGRGMELSELINFNGKLLTMDDRSGIVFEVLQEKRLAPRYILSEGDGKTDKGMKIEWSTIKNDQLYVGSFGKEYTNKKQKIVHKNNLWIATITDSGQISYHNWERNYQRLRKATGTEHPGYLIHEAICWSAIHKKWYILPRRSSQLPYDDELDEKRGTNLLIEASEDFNRINVKRVGKTTPERGFSSFKFLPRSGDNVCLVITCR